MCNVIRFIFWWEVLLKVRVVVVLEVGDLLMFINIGVLELGVVLLLE